MEIFDEKPYSKEILIIPLLLSLAICLTDLGSSILVWVYVSFCLLYTAIKPFEYSIGIILVNTVYLGYSFLNLAEFCPLSNTDFSNLCIVIVAIRYIFFYLKKNDFKIKTASISFPLLVLFLYVVERCYSQYLNLAIFTGSMLIVSYVCCKKCKENDEFASYFSQVFSLIVLTVFIYNALQMGKYDTTHSSWLGNRFTGVRDPNNFALWCNIGILLIHAFGYKIKKNYRNLIYVSLSLGAFLTLSMSGFASLVIIWLFIIGEIREKKKIAFLGVVLAVMMLVLPIVISILSNSTSAIGVIFTRIENILFALETGDYSAATTGRSWLWNYYMSEFQNLPFKYQLIGNRSLIDATISTGVLSSHNEYIDLLISYGYIGLVSIIFMLTHKVLYRVFRNIEKKYVYIVLVVAMNLYFRSASGFLIWFCLLL